MERKKYLIKQITRTVVCFMCILTLFMQGFSIAEAKMKVEKTSVNTKATVNAKKVKVKCIDNKFMSFGMFSEGMMAVKDKVTGLWGYIDKSGKYIIKPQYYDAKPFSEGLAAVQTANGYFHFINKKGIISIEGKYSDIVPRFSGDIEGFKYGKALVKTSDNEYVLIDTKGKITLSYGKDSPTMIDKGGIIYDYFSYRVYDKEGISIQNFNGYTENAYGCHLLFNISTKYLIFENEEGQYIAGNNGIVLTEKQLNLDTEVSLGVSDDYVVAQKHLNGIYISALYDLKGNLIIDFKYSTLIPVTKDIIIAVNNAGNYAVIDENEKEIIPFKYNIKYFNRCAGANLISESVQTNGCLFYNYTDSKGIEHAKYYDLKTKKNYNTYFINVNGYKINSREFVYSSNGLCYENISNNGKNYTVYDKEGKLIGTYARNSGGSEISNLQNNFILSDNKMFIFE